MKTLQINHRTAGMKIMKSRMNILENDRSHKIARLALLVAIGQMALDLAKQKLPI